MTISTSRETAAGCSNECNLANDGDCDDGGSGSEYSSCQAGTDCADCGQRAAIPPGSYGTSCSTSTPCLDNLFCNFDYGSTGFCERCSGCTTGSYGCSWCGLPSDGEADCKLHCEAGTGSTTSPPPSPKPPPPPSPPAQASSSGSTYRCDNTCLQSSGSYFTWWGSDGWCDDGGPGSDFSFCTLGTDCTDCGELSRAACAQHPHPSRSPWPSPSPRFQSEVGGPPAPVHMGFSSTSYTFTTST